MSDFWEKGEALEALNALDKATARFRNALEGREESAYGVPADELDRLLCLTESLSYLIEDRRKLCADDYRLYEVEVSSKHLVWVKGGDEAQAAHIAKHYTESNFLGTLAYEQHSDAEVSSVEHMETRGAQDWDPEIKPDAEV